MNTPNGCSMEHLEDELCSPRMKNKDDMSFVPLKYLYIKKLIPVVLDLYDVQYTCWSTLFRDAARTNNLLHHIDPTIPTPPPPGITIITSTDDDDDTTLCRQQQDAIVCSWIYATISPYLLMKLSNQIPFCSTSAMNVWACLRDMCQPYKTTVYYRKRRFVHNRKRRSVHIQDYQAAVDVDLISNLPDDLLVYMLSLVADTKTAAITCLLSKRWTHVWTHLMDLDFDDRETVNTLSFTAHPKLDKFVDRVYRVLIANRAPHLDTLRIKFPLNTCYDAHILNWLKFAFAKEVRNLDLDFGPYTRPRINYFNIFSSDPAFILNTTLTSFHLNSVAIKGPLLQWVLNNCLNLQRMSLHRCKASADDNVASIKNTRKLVVSSLKLKHLEFFYTLKLLNIQVLCLSAPNLTSVIIFEPKFNVEYHSIPSFVDATFGGKYSAHILRDLDSLSGFSSQLEKLSIRWFKEPSQFPTFVNLQQLEIVSRYMQDDLIISTSLIEACPLLHTFRMKMIRYNQQLEFTSQNSGPNHAQINAIRCHQHLKVVEFHGYFGCASAAELAICLANHAPMLQRFVFDTRQPQHLESLCKTNDNRDRVVIVRRTELLAKRIQRRQYPLDVVIL